MTTLGNILELELTNFTGSQNYYYNAINPDMKYTEGAKYFFENAGRGAYWFLTIILTTIYPMAIKFDEEFIVITLKSENNTAKIVTDDGNGNILYTQEIKYTDCPEGNWKFYLENNILYLPSER